MTDLIPGPLTNGIVLAGPTEPPPLAYPVTGDGLDWLRQLDWRQFEQLVGQAYRFQGYEVSATAPGADGGIDFILARGNERIFVQCKHWRAAQVGVPEAQELFALMTSHQATWGILATSGSYTAEAREFARQARTTLLDGPAVAQLIAIGQADQPNPGLPLNHLSPVPPPARPKAPSCPICNSAMKQREARLGPDAETPIWRCTRASAGGKACAAPPPPPPPIDTARPVAIAAPPEPESPAVPAARTLLTTVAPLAQRAAEATGAQLAKLGPLTHRALSATRTQLTKLGPLAQQGFLATRTQLAPLAQRSLEALKRFSPPRPVMVKAAVTVGVLAAISAVMASSGGSIMGAMNAFTLAPSTSNTVTFGKKPMDITFDAANQLIYTANYTSGDVTVIDSKSLMPRKTINVPGKPIGIAADPDHHRLFVADGAAAKIYVVSTESGKTTATIKLKDKATDLGFDATTQLLFVVSSAGQSLESFRTSNLTRVGGITTAGKPSSVAVDTAKHLVYVRSALGVTPYNGYYLTRGSRLTVSAGSSLAIDSQHQRLYLATATALAEHNLLTSKSRQFALTGTAGAICVDPSTQVAYVADPQANTISEVKLK
jgi:YVTN family beta-propeller protein